MADQTPAFSAAVPLPGKPSRPGKQTSSRPTMSSPNPPPARPNRRVLLAGALALATGLLNPSTVSANLSDTVSKTASEWRRTLSPAAYAVLRESATESPFSSPLNAEKRPGRFLCAGCGNPLYTSDAKFDSGTGWPSFFRALPDAVVTVETMQDRFLLQKEVRCRRCDGHLGHVFRDGPRPTGLRYCMNGVAMVFEPREG